MAEKSVFTRSSDINLALRRQIEKTKTAKIVGLKGQHNIACGINKDVKIQIEGDAGDFLGALNNGAFILLSGNAGRFVGDAMSKGIILIDGDVHHGAGIYMKGGILIIKGDCLGSVGQMMYDGTIIVNGTAGNYIGEYLSGGEIIITDDVGNNVGNLMTDGEIYVGGDIESTGINAKLTSLSSEDIKKIQGYVDSYKLRLSTEIDISDFKKIVPHKKNFLWGGEE